MLLRCHRRLEEMLAELVAAAGDWRRRLNPDALEVARDASAFLHRTALRHEADEEESVFVRLPASPLLETLAAEHREHRRCIEELGALLEHEHPDASALLRVAVDLERRYREHIEREEDELVPLIDAELGPATRAEIYQEMQARRGR